MVKRRAARYITNRYRNTSSVSSMLDHLQLESLESRRIKCQLTMMFKIVHDLVDIPPEKYFTSASTRTRSEHQQKFRQIQTSTKYYKNSFFPRTFVTGTPSRPVWSTIPLWYPSRGSSQSSLSKTNVRAGQM